MLENNNIVIKNIEIEKESLLSVLLQEYQQQAPKLLITLQAVEGVSMREISSAFRAFVKNRNFGSYFYCYEISDKGHIHVHVVTSSDFHYDYTGLKKSWLFVLSKKVSANIFKKYSASQALDCRPISSCEESYRSVLSYLLKCSDIRLCVLGRGVHKFGGSLKIRSHFAKYKTVSKLSFSYSMKSLISFEGKVVGVPVVESVVLSEVEASNNCIGNEKEDNASSNMNEKNVTIQGVNGKNYTFDGLLLEAQQEYGYSVEEQLFKEQLIGELSDYSATVQYFDFTNFVRFVGTQKSTIGKYFMDLYTVFKTLCSIRNNVIVDRFKVFMGQLPAYVKTTNLPYRSLLFYFISLYPDESDDLSLNSRVLFLLVNMLYRIFRSNGGSLLSFLKNLGAFVVGTISDEKRAELLGSYDLSTSDLVHIGHMLYAVLKLSVFHKDQNVITLTEESTTYAEGVVDGGSDDEDDLQVYLDGLNSYSQKIIYVDFNVVELSKMIPKFNRDRLYQIQLHTKIKKPFIIPPQKWKPEEASTLHNGVRFYDASKVCIGGLLINGKLIKRSLCKKSEHADHHLLLDSMGFDLLNKIQGTPYSLDRDLLAFYLSNKERLVGWLSSSQLLSKRKEFASSRARLKTLYLEKRALFDSGTCDPSLILEQISIQRAVVTSIREELSHHYLISRLLDGFKSIVKDPFYYAQEYDFRMRMYPLPHELSYAAHKLSRSLIRFYEKKSFSVKNFKLYCVSQYVDTRDKDEETKFVIFETEVRFLLEGYKKSEVIFIINGKAKEPFMFYACAVEWCRYINFADSDNYISGFPIYYDSTAQGPQIMSVFFALRTFSKYLNLCQQDVSQERGDYYSAVIVKYLEERRCSLEDYQKVQNSAQRVLVRSEVVLDAEIVDWFRKHLKQSIMTLIYGVSSQKFMIAMSSMCCSAEASKYLNKVFYIQDSVAFNKLFARDFWKYTHDLPIFQMKPLLNSFTKNLGKTGVLEWSVFGINVIRPKYLKVTRHQLKSRVFKQKYQLVIYDVLNEVLQRKQMSSLLANFTHSLDAWILRQLYSNCTFPMMSIHDSYGIHGIYMEQLKGEMRKLLQFLLSNGFEFFTTQWANCIERSAGVDAKNRFMAVVEEAKLAKGDLSKQDIEGAQHFIS